MQEEEREKKGFGRNRETFSKMKAKSVGRKTESREEKRRKQRDDRRWKGRCGWGGFS